MYLLPGFFVVDDRAYRDFQNDIAAFAACFVGTFSVASALGLVFGIEAEVNQRVMAFAGFHDDVAAFSAISARRTATGDELFAAERKTAVSAVPGLHSNCGFINEHTKSPRSSVLSGRHCADLRTGDRGLRTELRASRPQLETRNPVL